MFRLQVLQHLRHRSRNLGLVIAFGADHLEAHRHESVQSCGLRAFSDRVAHRRNLIET